MITRRAALLLVVSALCASCRSQPSSGAAPATGDSPSAAPATYNIITAQQIADANLLGNVAYVVVQRLRPAYLIDKTAGPRRSTQPIMVSVNGGQLSALNALNAIPASTIAEIRYLTLGEATQRFNNRNSGPVILVTLMSR
jgi:hypothetical protein